MSGSTRRQAGFGLMLAAAVLAIAALAFGGIGMLKDNPAKAESFSEENPAVGSQQNDDPVVPEEFQDWTDVDQFLKQPDTTWYADCLDEHLGISRENVAQYAKVVKDGHDLRFIVISNSSVSDQEARDRLNEQGVPDVGLLPILRTNGFENTRGIPSDRCQSFGDDRNQVRISLGIPMDPNDPTKGMTMDKGVLAMCGNMWKLFRQPTTTTTPPVTIPPVTTTRPGSTTTTTRPGETTSTTGRKGSAVTVTTTPAPPTTASPPSTTNTTQGSGPGAFNTTSTTPPTTAPPNDQVTTTESPPTTRVEY